MLGNTIFRKPFAGALSLAEGYKDYSSLGTLLYAPLPLVDYKVQPYGDESTDSEDRNKEDEKFFAQLRAEAPAFIRQVRDTLFEDGMDNPPIERVRAYISEAKYVTMCWLYELYSCHQEDKCLLSGLLRIIAATTEHDDFNILLPMVKVCLCDHSAEVQEAAIMVIEEWRTRECLTALQSARIDNPCINQYAQDVIEELQAELSE